MVMPITADERRPRRTEEQIIGAMAGHAGSGLAVTLGGEPRHLRPLSIASERKWKAQVGPIVQMAAEAAVNVADLDDAAGISAIIGSNLDEVLDLIVSFDALGDGTLNRDWLEENATGIEARDTLEVLLDSVYPPMPGGAARPGTILLSILLRAAAIRSVSSTSGSSPATRGSTGPRTSKRR